MHLWKLANILLLITLCQPRCSFCDEAGYFTAIDGFLCINSAFVETLLGVATSGCAHLCSWRRLCQAFSTSEGPCHLFVFDRCSKGVRKCSCSKRGRVFVKQQPGLQAGSLCYHGYGDSLCGVKYRFYNLSTNWHSAKSKCESEPGLTIMADITDESEKNHTIRLQRAYNPSDIVFLSGFQPAGSVEPGGGWIWASCNISVAPPSLWHPGEPNNGGGSGERITGIVPTRGLSDIPYENGATLCECLSPFD